MKNFSSSPQEAFNSFWKNRSLIKILVIREVLGRYKGSIFGILWSFFNPVFMLIVYTFVFSVVFKTRWGSGGDSKTEFALILFAGLIIFNLFAECLNRSPGLILANLAAGFSGISSVSCSDRFSSLVGRLLYFFWGTPFNSLTLSFSNSSSAIFYSWY